MAKTMEKQTIVLGSESFKFGERLRSRSVPMFPLKHCGRSKFADKKIKSNLNQSLGYPLAQTSNSSGEERNSAFSKIPRYKTVNYAKSAKPKTDTRANPKYNSSSKTSKEVVVSTNASSDASSLLLKHKSHPSTSYKHSQIKSRVDTSDPAPWIHTPKRILEELAELDGFILNPRFRGIVESKSFDSVQEILEILDREGEGPIVRVPLKRHQPDPPAQEDEDGNISPIPVQENKDNAEVEYQCSNGDQVQDIESISKELEDRNVVNEEIQRSDVLDNPVAAFKEDGDDAND